MRSFAACSPLILAAALVWGTLAGQGAVQPGNDGKAPTGAGIRPVWLVRTDGQPLPLTTATAWAMGVPNGVLLLDSPALRAANERFLSAWQPTHCRVIVLVSDSDATLTPRSDRAVVCADGSRRTLLAAAGLAVAAEARLIIRPAAPDGLTDRLRRLGTREVLLVGPTSSLPPLDNVAVRRFDNEAAVLAATIEFQAKRGPIDTIVLVNPTEERLSNLAPLALRGRRAVLLMTSASGADAGEIVRTALKQPGLESVENLLILASPAAIPPERRENPLAGKDTEIEMEPGTPLGKEPYTLAIGRLFHADPGYVALTLARARLLPPDGSPRTALLASNPGGSLPLLETFSRTSARELQTCGYQTTSLINDQLSAGQLQRRLPEADLFLWEGHHNTLIKDWGFTTWSEPLRPSFIFLQSCLALTEEKASPLIERGALAVVGSSSRIYSATGGAFSLACLDAAVYERQSLGGALRSAKNFLLAYGRLKEKRLVQAKLTGANQRSAWAFTLWGDPALRLPAPQAAGDPAAPPVGIHCRSAGDTITLSVPPAAAQLSTSGPYQAVYRPNGRLAGLLRTGEDGEKRLVSLAFSEVALPRAPAHHRPHLRTKLPDNQWVFVWDTRRRTGWLLVALPATAEREFRFRVEWDAEG